MAVKKELNKKVRDFVLTVAGTFVLCISVEMFLLPYNILSGGVAGLGVALYPFFHINTTLFANVMTVVLLFIGAFFLGKEFFLNTMVSSLLYPVFNSFIMHFFPVPAISPALASFYGGLIGGVGIGIVFRGGASTGGMDIPPLIIHKLTGVKLSTLIMIIDGLTVLLGWFSYGISDVLIGMLSVFASTYGINRILSIGQGSSSKSVQIISDHWQAICDAITEKLDRSATILDGTGAYSHEERKVVLAVVDHKQYTELLELINGVDPRAFVITTDATDMHGEGWTYPGI